MSLGRQARRRRPDVAQVRRSVIVIGLALSIGGCGKVLGADQYRVGPAVCRTFESGTCGQCTAQHCCDEADACRAESECRSFAECVAKYPPDDGAHIHDCYQAQPKTKAMGRYQSCLLKNCFEKCDVCTSLGAPLGSTCGDCFRDQSCTELMTCLQDPECNALHACRAECPGWETDPGCRLGCSAAHPAAHDLDAAFVGTLGGCSAACGFGTHWECIGPSGPLFSLPGGTATQILVHLTDEKGNPGPQGATVQSCPENVGTCGPTATVGGDGTALVTIGQAILSSHLDISVPDEGGVHRVLYYAGHPWIGSPAEAYVIAPGHSLFFGEAAPGRPITQTSDTGAVLAFMADCLGSSSDTAGSSLSMDTSIAPTYVRNFIPDTTAHDGDEGYFFNVPEGNHIVEGWDPRRRRVDKAPVLVYANAITEVFLDLPGD